MVHSRTQNKGFISKVYFGFLVFWLITIQSYSQNSQVSLFTNRLLLSEFREEDKSFWKVMDQEEFSYKIAFDKYLLESKKGKYYTGLNYGQIPKEYVLSTDFRFLPKQSLWGSMGIVFGQKGKLEGSFLFQINKKNEFRLLRFKTESLIEPISEPEKGKAYGWRSFPEMDLGKWINVKIMALGNDFYFIIENKEVYSYAFKEKENIGGVGFYLDGPLQAEVDRFSIFGKPGASPLTIEVKPEKYKEPEIITQENAPDTGMNPTLLNSIEYYKKENILLKSSIKTMKQEKEVLRNKISDLQLSISELSGQKNPLSNKEMLEKLKKTEKENQYLKEEIATLNSYKKTILESKDKDALLYLTDQLKKEQQKNAELTNKLKAKKQK